MKLGEERTNAREVALRYLYMADQRGYGELPDLAGYLQDEADSAGSRAYAKVLVEGCLADREELDQRLTAVASNWNLVRMAAIDRNCLRLGAFELLKSGDVPPKTAVDEAIRLAKKFGGAQSGAFVNGVLDRILKQVAESRP